jgi:hypothetical protein
VLGAAPRLRRQLRRRRRAFVEAAGGEPSDRAERACRRKCAGAGADRLTEVSAPARPRCEAGSGRVRSASPLVQGRGKRGEVLDGLGFNGGADSLILPPWLGGLRVRGSDGRRQMGSLWGWFGAVARSEKGGALRRRAQPLLPVGREAAFRALYVDRGASRSLGARRSLQLLGCLSADGRTAAQDQRPQTGAGSPRQRRIRRSVRPCAARARGEGVRRGLTPLTLEGWSSSSS